MDPFTIGAAVLAAALAGGGGALVVRRRRRTRAELAAAAERERLDQEATTAAEQAQLEQEEAERLEAEQLAAYEAAVQEAIAEALEEHEQHAAQCPAKFDACVPGALPEGKRPPAAQRQHAIAVRVQRKLERRELPVPADLEARVRRASPR